MSATVNGLRLHSLPPGLTPTNFALRRYTSGPAYKPTISTLLPLKIRSTDFLEDLPDVFHRFYQGATRQSFQVSLAQRHRGSSIAWAPATPPKPCRGFLYYHAPQATSFLAGSLRFRLTPGFDPASASPQAAFAADSDLQVPDADGLPWAVPLWTLVKSKRLNHFRGVLEADGVKMPDPKWKGMKDLTETSVALYALGQPFLVEFHMASLRVYLFQAYPEPPLVACIEPGFFDWTSKKFRQPYDGMGIMTVERLQGTLGIRLQKILSLDQTAKNDKIARPVEGETYQLQVGPVLFKEATKRTSSKYLGPQKRLWMQISKLPHISETAC